jgi:MFS family permease
MFDDTIGSELGFDTHEIAWLYSGMWLVACLYCESIPMNLQSPIDASVMMAVWYTVYSMPNIFMVFIGGALIDRIGTNKYGRRSVPLRCVVSQY